MNFQKFLILLALLAAFQPTKPAHISPAWQSKVDPWLLKRSDKRSDKPGVEPLEFLVYLSEQADLHPAALLPDKQARGQFVVQRLAETARRTQAPLLAALQQRGLEYRSYWVANFIWVRGDPDDLAFLAGRGDVARIYPNPSIQVDLPPALPILGPEAPAAIEWNVQQIQAPRAWELGVTGQGVVIGGQDTGYQWDHPALIKQYRGWDGATADHNYNWHDAIHSGGVAGCLADSQIPCDDRGHGTHTLGTMLGDDGLGNQVGVAPGARWIGCRNMDNGVGTPTTYSECFQWFLAPTDLSGQNPRPDLAPDIINNSWSCPPDEGCNPDSLLTIVENMRAAGILVVVSAGNSGSSCSSINTPAAIYDASFTIGATDSLDNIASFSSRGPVSVDGSQRPKPDVSAPGVSVRSTTPGGYGYSSGTSMAAPHVSGLAALLLSANPALRGQVELLEQLIAGNAVPRTTPETCGGLPGAQIPNNTYGYGRIDAWLALQQAAPSLFQRHYLPAIFTP